MQIKPRNISGLLLAIQGRRDYLILQMIDGTMTFTVDNGRGPITAVFKPSNQFQFCDGQWHEIHGMYIQGASLNQKRLLLYSGLRLIEPAAY